MAKPTYLVVFLGSDWAQVSILDEGKNTMVGRQCIPAKRGKKDEKFSLFRFKPPHIKSAYYAVRSGRFDDGQKHKHTSIPLGEFRGNCFSNAARYIQEAYSPVKRAIRGKDHGMARDLPSSHVTYEWTRKDLVKWMEELVMWRKLGFHKK